MVLGIWYFVSYVAILFLCLSIRISRQFIYVHKAEVVSATSAYIYLLADMKAQGTEELFPGYTWQDCNFCLVMIGLAMFAASLVLGYKKNKDIETLQQTRKELAALQHTHQKINDEYYALCSDYIKIIFQSFFTANVHTHARVSIYKHKGTHFTLLGRCSDNPKYNKRGLQTYPDDEGFIALGWQQKTYAIHGIPEWQHKGANYIKYMKGKCHIKEDRLRKLTMHSRSFYVLRLDNPDGAQPHGIVVFETINDTPIDTEPIDAVFNKHTKQIIAFIKTMKTLDKTPAI